MRHERLRLLRFASWIEQADERAQTTAGGSKGSLRTTEGYCSQPPSGRGGFGPLQNHGCGGSSGRVLADTILQIHRVLKRKAMNHATANSSLQKPEPTENAGSSSADRFAYRVGDISFGVSAGDDLRLCLDPGVSPFECDSESCDVEILAEWAEQLEMPSTPPAFESGGLWSAFEEDGGTAFYFNTSYLGKAPYKRAWFDSGYKNGWVQLLKRYFDADTPVYPLEYPLDELLMIHRLARGEGAEVHACGVVTANGIGRLFVGHSGAGKSTTSHLWLRQPGVTVLSDDRIILRMRQGRPVMHGTPWHGDAGLAAQACGPIHQIFLLEHAARNEIVPLEPSRAAAELFTRTFVPYHSAAGLTHTLQFLEQLTEQVPVAVFRFRPDATAIEEIVRAA